MISSTEAGRLNLERDTKSRISKLCSNRELRRALLAILAIGLTACSPKETEISVPLPPDSTSMSDLERYHGSSIGKPIDGRPWVAHVRAVDLDKDGLMDAIGCEAKDDEVVWLRQLESGGFEEILIGSEMQAPVHAEVYDLDQDGDLDVLVSCMNIVFPNNDKIGALIVLENDGQQNFTKRILLEHVQRVTDARAADLDGDGDLDIAVGQFGYDQGEVRWMKQTGPWTFESEILIRLSGTVNVTVDDYDGDGTLDIAAQISQQWEEIHILFNDGRGHFEEKVVWGSTNEDFASSGMTSADINGDGRMDLIFVNGDGFGPSALPGPRPWHGVQWLENKGDRNFEYHRIGDLGGAYSPVVIDIDKDEDLDVVALSAFNDWSNPKAESMVWFENDGKMNFTMRILAHDPIQLLTIDAADFNGDGNYEFISGGFHAYYPYERMSRFMLWQPTVETKR